MNLYAIALASAAAVFGTYVIKAIASLWQSALLAAAEAGDDALADLDGEWSE